MACPAAANRYKQDRSIAEVVPKIGTPSHQPLVLSRRQMGRTSARSIDLGDLVGGFAVHGAKTMAPDFVAHHDKDPVLGVATRGSADRRIEDPGNELVRDRVVFQATLCAGSVHRLK